MSAPASGRDSFDEPLEVRELEDFFDPRDPYGYLAEDALYLVDGPLVEDEGEGWALSEEEEWSGFSRM